MTLQDWVRTVNRELEGEGLTIRLPVRLDPARNYEFLVEWPLPGQNGHRSERLNDKKAELALILRANYITNPSVSIQGSRDEPGFFFTFKVPLHEMTDVLERTAQTAVVPLKV